MKKSLRWTGCTENISREFIKTKHPQKTLNKIGQTLWDFYMYQMHVLKQVHADPHPGNFLISEKGELMVIDFGCVKEIPSDFYEPYFELAKVENLMNQAFFEQKLYELEILKPEDSSEEKVFFSKLFHEMLELFTRPFNQEFFDFSDENSSRNCRFRSALCQTQRFKKHEYQPWFKTFYLSEPNVFWFI